MHDFFSAFLVADCLLLGDVLADALAEADGDADASVLLFERDIHHHMPTPAAISTTTTAMITGTSHLRGFFGGCEPVPGATGAGGTLPGVTGGTMGACCWVAGSGGNAGIGVVKAVCGCETGVRICVGDSDCGTGVAASGCWDDCG